MSVSVDLHTGEYVVNQEEGVKSKTLTAKGDRGGNGLSDGLHSKFWGCLGSGKNGKL